MAGCEHSLFTAGRGGAEVAEAATLARPRRAQHTSHCWRPKRGANPGGGPGDPHSVTCQCTERPPHTSVALSVHPLRGACRAGRERERRARGPPPSLSAGAGATETSFPAVGLSRATDGTAR